MFTKNNGPNWLPIGVITLAVFFLSPLLETGYISDDIFNSFFRGYVEYEGTCLTELTIRIIKEWIGAGRFYPLAFFSTYTLFYILNDVWIYKSIVMIAIVINLVIFFLFLKEASGSRKFALLSTLMVIGLFQFRSSYHDPILAFSLLMQNICLFTFGSLYFLSAYLNAKGKVWLYLSITFYLVSVLYYEIPYLFCLLHIWLIWAISRNFRTVIKVSFPFVLIGLSMIVLGVYLRHEVGALTMGPTAGPYSANFSIEIVLQTLFRQLFAALPLSYFFADHANIFPTLANLLSTSEQKLEGLLVFVVAFILISVSTTKYFSKPQPKHRNFLLFLPMGMMIWFLSALPISLANKYQQELTGGGWGYGHLPVYIEYYGVALVSATLIMFLLSQLSRHKIWRGIMVFVTSTAIAAVTSMTYFANTLVVSNLIDASDFSARANIETALQAGLLNNVPENSTLILPKNYLFSKPQFYRMHSGKNFNIGMTIQPALGEVYELKDFVGVGGHHKNGIIVLNRGGDKVTKEILMFLRFPYLGTKVGTLNFTVNGNFHNGQSFSIPYSTLKVISQERDWIIYSLTSEIEMDSDSVKLTLQLTD